MSKQNDRSAAVHVERLLAYAHKQRLLDPLDIDAARNALLDLFGWTEPAEEQMRFTPDGDAQQAQLPAAGQRAVKQEAAQGAYDEQFADPTPLLEPLLEEALRLGLIESDTTTDRDLFDARMMGLLMARPSEIVRQFRALAEGESIAAATDWFYRLNIAANYIRMDRIRKNSYWRHMTDDGELEITINLSKPEKDPREIARLKTLPPSSYPKCLLCKENVGYVGRPNHPARQNLRTIPVTLQGEAWFFQYSPYVYYREHSIVFCGEHVPMKITPDTFARLLDFIDQFPHYFIGSNADLPIVGGSILSHDHFQAGRHIFPMEKASVPEWFTVKDAPGVRAGIVRWPMSVLRLRAADRGEILRVCERVLSAWRSYSDRSVDVLAYTGKTPHNTITPIARRRENGEYEMDLVLRNNRTSERFPDGIFHPHPERHHIKKENIGLIEVMGLAVLPGRLQQELAAISEMLCGNVPYDPLLLNEATHPLHHHAPWLAELVGEYGTSLSKQAASELLRAAVGDKFHAVLRDAGVFKNDSRGQAAFQRFLAHANILASSNNG